MLKETAAANSDGKNVQHLQSEVEYRSKLQEIANKLNAATHLDEILIGLKDEITALFDVDRLTVYVIDGVKRELVSRFKSGNEIAEIRIPVSPGSIAGYCAYNQTLVNIKNVYDEKELATIDPDLKFDYSWDQKTGFTTKQVLAYPIIFKKFLMGAIQLINRKYNKPFSAIDEQSVTELAKERFLDK